MTSDRHIVLLTQRVEIAAAYGERRDALDHAWMRLLADMGHDGFVAPNHAAMALSQLRRLDPDLVILTGGNGVIPGSTNHAPERNETEAALLVWARDAGKPVLGICRGFQFMNVHLGGGLTRLEGHVTTAHPTSLADAGPGEVNSFHNLGIMPDVLAPELAAAAHAPDGSIEAAQHRRLPWAGIMWHPERDMPDANGSRRWFAECVARLINRKAAFDIG
jgi:gamma-glutamyl-gamma-aminobutyrate hydrolase PuuD